MKFHLLSDTHIEFGKFSYKHTIFPDCDAILLAGDIGPGASGFTFAEKVYRDKGIPVFYVPGNHEGYTNRWSWDSLYSHLKAKDSFVQFMQNEKVEFSDSKVVLLGSTLWTDFSLNGVQQVDMLRAPSVMNDYNWITTSKDKKLTSEWVLEQNSISKDFLESNIIKYKDIGWKTVVMTHHAPFVKSCDIFHSNTASIYDRRDDVYYANCLAYDFPLPDIWVHGHTHTSADYTVENCRVIANPKGYTLRGKPENIEFKLDFTFEV